MKPNIKHGLLVGHNSDITDQQLDSLIQSNESIHDYYYFEKDYFARGKFAHVHRIQHKQTGEYYAAKTMRKRRPRSGDVTDEIRHEIRVLMISTLNECDRIVKLYEVYETRTEFILVLELAKGGELQKVLDDDDCIEEEQCRRLMRQIIQGVHFLHQKRIAHLDLKPQNILLSDTLPNGNVKLCDFGISRLIDDNCEIKEIIGTEDYMPPEILKYEPISLASDMWSIGIVTYVLLSGHSPFGDDDKIRTYANITQGVLEFPDKLFSSISKEAKDFITKLLVQNPKNRMDCAQCLEHEWLKMERDLPSTPKLLDYKINDSTSISDLDEEKNVNFEDETDKSCTTTSPFSSIASLTEVPADADKDDKNVLKNSLPDLDEINNRDSGFDGNICDTNINVDLTDGESKSNSKIDLIINDKDSIIGSDNGKENENLSETELNNGLEQRANKYHHHKRLSSDTLSNRRFIAVVSSTLLSTKKFTSESSMFIADALNITNNTIENQEQKCIKRLPLITLPSSQNLSKNVDHDLNTVIQSSAENSPPSTPSKKIYLSNDYEHYIGKYLPLMNTINTNSQNDLNSPRRIRSMERLDHSSLNYNRTLSFSHHNDISITFPLATLTTTTAETFYDNRIDSYSSTSIKTTSPIIVNNKSNEGFHITIKKE